MSFAPGIRLELRQQQSLVLTPQLQQAIRLLQMSNVELASAIDQEVAENPFLQRSDAEAAPRRGVVATASPRALGAAPPAPSIGAAPMSPFRPADCSLSLKRPAGKAFEDDRQPFEDRLTRAKGLREHLGEQVLAMLHHPHERAIAPSAGREHRRRRLSTRGRRRAGGALQHRPGGRPGGAPGDPALRADRRRRARSRRMPGAAAGREEPARSRRWRHWWPTCRCSPARISPS